jgi:protein TonB
MNAARLHHRPADGLTPAQRRVAVGGIVALHAAAAWGLMQVEAVRDAVADAAPIFVSMIQPAAEPARPRPQEVTTPRQTPPPPLPPRRIVTAAPSPQPSTQSATEPSPPAPAAETSPQAAIHSPAEVPAPPSAPAPEPRQIPPSAVQYLDAPVLQVPQASARAGESGRSVVRVLIDEHGLPRTVQIAQSSGFKRLDEAALAAVRRARFRPYTENGQPQAGWAHIPLVFELEQ